MAGGAIEARLEAMIRNEKAIIEHANGTRTRIAELEKHVEELKQTIYTQSTEMATLKRDIVMIRTQALGGGIA